jgi:hypothetical protein
MGLKPAGLKARRELPGSHSKTWGLDLTRNHKAALALNIAALPLFVVFGWIFLQIAALLRPEIVSRLFVARITPYPLVFFLILLTVVVGTMFVHEAIHGAFFWLFTHSRPIFGMKLLFAYAGAPEWYIPRNQYALTGVAPFVLITIVGFLVVAWAPLAVGQLALFGVIMNASGAVGDLYVSTKVMLQSRDVLIQDTGVGFTMFSPMDKSI